MVTREQVKMARAAMGWGVRDLAAKIGVAANTISRFENGSDAYGETLFAKSGVHLKMKASFSSMKTVVARGSG